MELVLSPGRLGGTGDKTGSPFQNEEVREWSHVDRLTGMLEHARIETGRWQTRHQGTAQAYGKVIDSRERNSADGNVVQKARRQVEVFQSQGIGGRSVQVVRASQWSSSRITDSTSSSPVSMSMNDTAQLRNGNDESLAKLSQVSRLCRQINGETVSAGLSKRSAIMESKILSDSPLIVNRLKKFEGIRDGRDGKIGSSGSIVNNLKCASNEDLTKSIDSNKKSHTIFTRDSRTRRSLQIPKSQIVTTDIQRNINQEPRLNDEETDFLDEKSSRSNSSGSSDREISMIQNNRKNVKSYVLGMEEIDSDTLTSSLSLPKTITDKKYLFNGTTRAAEENGKDIVKSEYLRPTPILLKPKSVQSIGLSNKSNTTVVHLNNKLFLDSRKITTTPSVDHELISTDNSNDAIIRANDNSSTVQSRVQSLANRFAHGNQRYGHDGIGVANDASNSFVNSTLSKRQLIIDSNSSRIENLINRSAAINTIQSENSTDSIFPGLISEKKITDESIVGVQSGKPIKKVGFCKTEVHFAAESGKVNIVETDCKPPPSNRFRRRRRNSMITNVPGIVQRNKNLPLIHFGDTSYEKYIFGQSRKDNKSMSELSAQEEEDFSIIQKGKDLASDDLILRDGWGARIKTILQSDPVPNINENEDVSETTNFDQHDETIVDHTFKGSHTTTVNLGAEVISKIQKHTNEGKCNTISTGIQLQFDTRPQKLLPVTSTSDITPSVGVPKNRPTKNIVAGEKSPPPFSIVVSTVSKIPRPLIQTQQSVLKSAHLVMNLNRIKNLNSMVKITGNNNSYLNNCESKNENPLSLKHLLSSLHDNCAGMVMRRNDHSDVDIVNNNYAKNTSTLITINANDNMKTNYKTRISNSSEYPTRFTPLELKSFNDRLNRCEEGKRIGDRNDSKENQLQYSSGSEQADEEVRSYMLGGKIEHTYTRHKKFSHSRSITMEACTGGSVEKTQEKHSNSCTVNETRDIDDTIDNIDENHTIDNELDIVNSGLPVEEICFEANTTVERNHLPDKVMNESNVVTSDNENNKVLLNIVTTHEPVIARVEDRHSPESRRELFATKKLRSSSTTHVSEENGKTPRETNRSNKSYSSSAKKPSIKHKAKDHCDNKTEKEVTSSLNDDTNATDPTYVNVFEGGKKSIPVYENCRVLRKNNINDKKYAKKTIHTANVIQSLAEMNDVVETTLQSTNGNCDVETSLSNTDCEDENFQKYSKSRDSDAQLTTISESNSNKRNNRDDQKLKPSKIRSKKTVARTPSSTSSIESNYRSSGNETIRDSEAKSLHTKSTRSSRLRRATSTHETSANETIERYSSNDKKKNTTQRTANTKLPRSNHSADTSTASKSDEGIKNLNDNTRSKKPIEIVYQTAVFNMKNEKLAKSSKSKDSKTPRYINDLICGSRPKRSTDVRHVKGAALSQQRVHHKSASPTSRHWK